MISCLKIQLMPGTFCARVPKMHPYAVSGVHCSLDMSAIN